MESDLHKNDSEVLALSIDHPSAFAIIVDRYQKDFLRKITFILKNEEEAEDIVQETFVKIYINAKKFKVQEGASFKSWAYRILLNTCFTYCKKKNRQKLFQDFAASEDMDLFRSNDDFEAKIYKDEVMSVLSKIPQGLATMLHLNVIEGKSYEDIAESEQISVGAVRTRMHRAKAAFKKVLKMYAAK